jgi:hypothetical protein
MPEKNYFFFAAFFLAGFFLAAAFFLAIGITPYQSPV